MDGDLRPRFRRRQAGVVDGRVWGYSATLPSDIAHPQPIVPSTSRPRADVGRPHREQDDGKQSRSSEKPKDDEKTDEQKPDEKPKMPGWKKALYWLIGLIVLAVLVTAATLYYLHARHFENTDDAFIDGHQSQISAQVAAKVVTLAIEDNQQVSRGAPILQLDPRDYQVKLDQARAQQTQAKAQLQQAEAGILQQQASLDQAIANVHVAEADLGQQQADLARYRAIDPKAITRQQLDNSSAQTKSAAARVDANKQAVEGARAMIESQKAQVAGAAANVQVANVAVENAQLQLSYTTVTAPDDGRVTRRTVEVGNYVNPGQSLLAIVPDRMWVTANFKETQLADMHPGQAVRVRVDACPGVDIPGHVDSFQTGTGAVFSSLPAENATGNYVKVVQRVPVKIVFDSRPAPDQCRLAPGLSVSPRVTVR